MDIRSKLDSDYALASADRTVSGGLLALVSVLDTPSRLVRRSGLVDVGTMTAVGRSSRLVRSPVLAPLAATVLPRPLVRRRNPAPAAHRPDDPPGERRR